MELIIRYFGKMVKLPYQVCVSCNYLNRLTQLVLSLIISHQTKLACICLHVKHKPLW